MNNAGHTASPQSGAAGSTRLRNALGAVGTFSLVCTMIAFVLSFWWIQYCPRPSGPLFDLARAGFSIQWSGWSTSPSALELCGAPTPGSICYTHEGEVVFGTGWQLHSFQGFSLEWKPQLVLALLPEKGGISIPLWMPLLASLALMYPTIAARRRRRYRIRHNLCLNCAYPLAGLPSDRCPECGDVFKR